MEIHTTSNCLHFVSRVGTQVSASHPSQPHPPKPSYLPANPASGPRRVYPLPSPRPQYQVPSDFQLQILPGDEIVQVNEQVVVSEEERDMVGVKELLSRTQAWWVGKDPWGDQGYGSCIARREPAHTAQSRLSRAQVRGLVKLPGRRGYETEEEAERVL